MKHEGHICLCTLVIPFYYCNVLALYFNLFNIYVFVIFGSFNITESSLDIQHQIEECLVDNELERMRKETAMA
jgi:hypothetical protein